MSLLVKFPLFRHIHFVQPNNDRIRGLLVLFWQKIEKENI